MGNRVLLVVPPVFLDPKPDFEVGFPVSLAHLGRIASEEGWEVTYVDMALEAKDGLDGFARLAAALSDAQTRVVGVTSHTVRASSTTCAVAKFVKARRPDIEVVVGGVNATFAARPLLTNCPAIDVVLRGYAQPAWRTYLANGRADPAIPGVVTRETPTGPLTAPPPVLASEFRAPCIADLPAHRYLRWTSTYPILARMGCGFSCRFCTSVMPGPYQRKEVARPIPDVLDELCHATNLGFRRFAFSDNVFTSDPDYVTALCEAIRASGLSRRAAWSCMTRVEAVSRPLLAQMRDAGCTDVAFGVEGAGPDQWRSLRKGRYSEDTIDSAFAATKAEGIASTAFLILGAPDQTPADVEETMRLIRRVRPDHRVVNFFQPFPGTQYWDDPERYGLADLAPTEQWAFSEGPICTTRYFDKAGLWRAAVRLQLECPHGDTLNPDAVVPVLVPGYKPAAAAVPRAVAAAVTWLDNRPTVAEWLERMADTFSLRDRLVGLYWLTQGVRDSVVRLVDPVFVGYSETSAPLGTVAAPSVELTVSHGCAD
jgi:pyruvate-formate lyase-activating enzyme